MKLETLRVERRKSGRLDIQLQLSTNPTELQENFRLLKNGVPVPALEAIFEEANRYVSRIRINLNVGNPALYGLPESVTFRDCLKPNITDSDVEEALSRVLRPAKPPKAFTRKVLLGASERFESQKEVGRL